MICHQWNRIASLCSHAILLDRGVWPRVEPRQNALQKTCRIRRRPTCQTKKPHPFESAEPEAVTETSFGRASWFAFGFTEVSWMESIAIRGSLRPRSNR
jgi:hypothetical protein